MKFISKKKASKRRTYRLKIHKSWMTVTKRGIVGRRKRSLKAGKHLDEQIKEENG